MPTSEEFVEVNKIYEKMKGELEKLHGMCRLPITNKEAIEGRYQKYAALDDEYRRKVAKLIRSIPL